MPTIPNTNPRQTLPNSSIPSSSPAFATPAFPLRPLPVIPSSIPQSSTPSSSSATPLKPTILPIKLPPATLRPIAFRIFTKKHSLTLTPGVLALLATFVGRFCGAGWRDEGLAEGVLDEVAREWKKSGGAVILDGGDRMSRILKSLEGVMVAGRVSREMIANGEQRDEDDEDGTVSKDMREWVQVVDAFQMPRLVFNPTTKQLDR